MTRFIKMHGEMLKISEVRIAPNLVGSGREWKEEVEFQ
jgi:hypothetical protein